jgi:hypothetical protein
MGRKTNLYFNATTPAPLGDRTSTDGAVETSHEDAVDLGAD